MRACELHAKVLSSINPGIFTGIFRGGGASSLKVQQRASYIRIREYVLSVTAGQPPFFLIKESNYYSGRCGLAI